MVQKGENMIIKKLKTSKCVHILIYIITLNVFVLK